MDLEGKDGLDRWDRVRVNTSPELNERLDRETQERLHYYATQSPEVISERIEILEQEWDIERMLEANAAVLAFTGVLLAALHSRRWLALPGLVLPFLLQHALQGWCPPLLVLRRIGIRTRREIDVEKFALKALRGDFVNVDALQKDNPLARGGAAVSAARH
jgi:hypothetical protein